MCIKLCIKGKVVLELPYCDADMAWDNFESEFSVWNNGDGTVDIEAYGYVLLKNYKPEHPPVANEEGWIFDKEDIYQEVVFEKGLVSLCED